MDKTKPLDLRIYIGMVIFRWKIIVSFLLYSLLAGVLFINLAPKKYLIHGGIMVYSEPLLEVSAKGQFWVSFGVHADMLTDAGARGEVVNLLTPKWGSVVGDPNKMMLNVSVHANPNKWALISVNTLSENLEYGKAFLQLLLERHTQRWEDRRNAVTSRWEQELTDELATLDDKVRAARDQVIEFERLNDITRVTTRESVEQQYIQSLISQRSALNTQLMLLEAQFPALKGENVAVIDGVSRLMQQNRIGSLETPDAAEPIQETAAGAVDGVSADGAQSVDTVQTGFIDETTDDRGWQDIRLKLDDLEVQEREMLGSLKPGHPQLRSVRTEIERLQNQLKVAAELQLRHMRDQHKSLTILRDAIESAEYKWQAKNTQVRQKRAELSLLESTVKRLEESYQTLFSRLHDLRISEEFKAERVGMGSVTASNTPVWPNTMQVMLICLAVGLGSGFGLALLTQVVDNKVQTVSDVEEELGVPFLGGIPFWVHSGLERAIRPIVTEEHSSGAIEAYRALRTGVLTALEKMNEKMVMITSADSREGKTLTALNLAIMIAQMNKRVLLVDLDLRRGRLHKSLGLDRDPGVTDVLSEGRHLKEVIVRTRIENLDLAPTGSSVNDAAELLQSSDLVNFFADVQDDYDYIVADTSPILRVTDTVILSTHGPGVLLYVARVNHTPKPLIRYSLSMLKEGRVLGLVMNSIEMHKISSLYYTYQYPNYAYYSNAYTYGYRQYGYAYAYSYGDETGARRMRGAARRWWHRRRQALSGWFRRTFLPLQ